MHKCPRSLFLYCCAFVLLCGVWCVSPCVAKTSLPLQRVALLIGHNQGGPSLEKLRFAERDAKRLSGLLQRLGGFRKQDMYLLEAPSLGAVRATMLRIRRKLRRAGKRGMFLFYFSGHAEKEHFRLNRERLTFAEVMRFARQLPVKVRLFLIDSCYSGRFLRAKGAKRFSGIQWATPRELRTRGVAILTSSEANGRSYESDRIKGSLFTSSLLAGLLGGADKNRDQRVSLSELHHYVYRQTLARSARKSVEIQRPSHRLELRGQGPLYLSYLGYAPASLLLPKRLQGHIFLYRGEELLHDFQKSVGRLVGMALEQGAYQIQVRHAGKLASYPVFLRRGERHRMAMTKLEWTKIQSNERGKGDIDERILRVGGLLRYSPMSPLSVHGVGLALGLDSGPLMRTSLAYHFSQLNPLDLPYDTHQLSLRLALGTGWTWSGWSLWVGGFLEPQLIFRRLPQQSLWNAGATGGALLHFDITLFSNVMLRTVLAGGANVTLYQPSVVRAVGMLDCRVGVVWNL